MPGPLVRPAARAAGTVAWLVMPNRRRLVERHVQRVAGHRLERHERNALSRAAFVSAARYWLDTFRLWRVDTDLLGPLVEPHGMELLTDALERGRGVVLATPHFGSWDLGGAWLAAQGIAVTAVMERIEPPRLRDWFVEVRRRVGVRVIVRGPDVWDRLVESLAANEVVVLVADRDLRGRGISAEFFGERTTLPKGPAELARRCGAPIVAVAIYDAVDGVHRGVGRTVLHADDANEGLDPEKVTQDLATAFEQLISAAPAQWHLFQPNWPSDRQR